MQRDNVRAVVGGGVVHRLRQRVVRLVAVGSCQIGIWGVILVQMSFGMDNRATGIAAEERVNEHVEGIVVVHEVGAVGC